MTTEPCPSSADIRAYLLGELAPVRLDLVARHLDNCPACDALAARLDAESDVVVNALRSTIGRAGGPIDPGAPPATVGDYQILSEVGRGGMGVVYKARHVGLNRLAAVKMILAGRFAGPEDQMRFRIEGEMLARLRHTNVVEVYETGQYDSRPFLALEWVDGGTLEALLTDPPPPRRAAEMVELLAEAVQHAHQNGVIHRDLKPANVLLTPEGTPKVTDFGLARPVSADAARLTVTGTVLGTPAYMAPEQARGEVKTVGPAADIYSLGAILFALLTGRPPFDGPNLEVLHAVLVEPAPSASRFRRGVPRDLDTIAHRCLEKDPARRYPSAAAVADDLRRWRTGRPILARPVPVWERLYRFTRRNPVPTAAAIVATAVIAGAFVRVEWGRKSEAEARRAAEAATTAEAAARQLAERREALAAADGAVLRCETDELAVGLDEFTRALALAEAAGDADLVRAVRANIAGWSARRPREVRMFDPPTPGYPIRTAVFLDGGRTLVTGGADGGIVRLWPMGGGPARELPSPTVRLRRPDAVAAFPDPTGKVLYVAEGTSRIRRWNPSTLTSAGPDLVFGLTSLLPEALSGLAISIQDAAISPDGWRLAAGEEGGTVRVWDTTTDQVLGPDLIHTQWNPKSTSPVAVTTVAFADSDTLLTGGRQDGVIVWDVPSGTRLARFGPVGDVFRLAVSPDRQTVLVGGKSEATLWPLGDLVDSVRKSKNKSGEFAKSFRPLRTWAHTERVEALTFSPDGRLAAVGDNAGNVRVWELTEGRSIARFRYTDQVRVLRFAPGGRGLVVGGMDGTSAFWELPSLPTIAQGRQPSFRVASAAGFSPDGERVWTVSSAGLAIWRIQSDRLVADRPVLRPEGPDTSVWSGTVSSDGRLAVTGGWRGETTRVWNLETGQPIGSPLKYPMTVGEVGFLPDGRTFFTRETDRHVGSVRWWRAVDDRLDELPSWPPQPDCLCLAPHPDCRRVLVGQRAGAFTGLREASTGAEIGPRLQHPTAVTAVAIHPGGRLAATGGQDGGVRVWNLDTGELRGRVAYHAGRVNRVTWGSGDLLATASDDGTARVWDIRTMLPLGPPLRHVAAVLAVSFNPAGRQLVTVDRDGGVAVWDMTLIR